MITLAADSFFAPGSAELNIDETRDTLLRIAQFLSSDELKDRRFRIEGHTDNTAVSGEVFPSIKKACESVGIKKGIGDCCRGKQHTAGGYHWQYYED